MEVQSLSIFRAIGRSAGWIEGLLIRRGGLGPLGNLKKARARMTRAHSPITGTLALLAGLAIGFDSGSAFAVADGPDFYVVRGVARDDVLNVRAEPDPRAPKVGEIPPDGTCIRNLGCKGGLSLQEFSNLSSREKERRERENPRWCKVEYQGITGWVAGRYLGEGYCRNTAASAPAPGRDIRTERVQFEPGASSAVIRGSITGYEVVDHVLRARKGQNMAVRMTSDNSGSYFNILAPGEDQIAMFNGAQNQNAYKGVLPESGAYKIRVYMMRSAARRNEVANYRLKLAVTDARRDQPVTGDYDEADSTASRRAGQRDFDATGRIRCAQFAGQPMAQCDFGVSRAGGGTATVVITRPDGRTRALFFTKGKFISADTAEADGYPEYRAEKESDLHRIRVGTERYEIPDAVIFGG